MAAMKRREKSTKTFEPVEDEDMAAEEASRGIKIGGRSIFKTRQAEVEVSRDK